jgi:crotonobetainyl-CoA:carnitine CoA-transferase CaiB-like acyl-CoA transferase
MYKPLKGIKVIDFTHVLAGPACSYYLGLLGADVIKVESVTNGDAMRYRGGTSESGNLMGMSTPFLTQAAGKKSIALNIASQKGFAIFEKLLKNTDVLVENHKPTTLKKLGINSDFISKVNDKLIHCALTGYGRKGDKENAAAYDVNIQAISGIMNLTGFEGQGPIRTGAPIIDYAVALAASFAISSALFKRTQSGKGSFIDVSMLETAYTLMSSTIVDYLYTGNEPKQRGNAANSKSPGAGSYECKKGLISLGINEEHQFVALAKMLKKENWLKDKRFSDKKSRKENEVSLIKQLEVILKSKTANDWEKLAVKFGVPAARILNLKESLELKQNQSRSFIHEFRNENLKVPTLPFRFNNQKNHAPTSPPSKLGQNTFEILNELGFDNKSIETFLENNVVFCNN